MTFDTKLDDKQLKVDLSVTNLADVLQYCKPKEQLVLLKKFGLSTNGQEIPLQRIGQEFNMTRERARQIESQALMRFRRLIVGNDKYLNLIEQATQILDDNGGLMLEGDLVKRVVDSGLTMFSPAEVKLILMSDFTITHLRRNKLLHKSFYMDPLYETLITIISSDVVHYFESQGSASNMIEYVDILKKTYSAKYPNVKYLKQNQFYMNLFSAIRGASIFDGKVWLNTFKSVNPKTIKDKIMHVFNVIGKPMHYQEMATKVMEFFPKKPVKVNTVHNEMVKSNQTFVNMGLGIYGLKSWWYQGGIVADILVRILHEYGRPMTIKELTQNVLKEKMCSPSTILLNLHKHKERFNKDDNGMYSLREWTSLEPTKSKKGRRKKNTA